MSTESLANCKNDNILKYDDLYSLPTDGVLEKDLISESVDQSIKYMFDKLMKTFPNDTARLFFLQSELLNKEFKEYQTEQTRWILHNAYRHKYKYKYYLEVKTKLNQLKEQCEQTRL